MLPARSWALMKACCFEFSFGSWSGIVFYLNGLISVSDDGNSPFCMNMWGFAARNLLHGFSFCRVMVICLIWVIYEGKDSTKFNGIWDRTWSYCHAWYIRANALDCQFGPMICRGQRLTIANCFWWIALCYNHLLAGISRFHRKNCFEAGWIATFAETDLTSWNDNFCWW